MDLPREVAAACPRAFCPWLRSSPPALQVSPDTRPVPARTGPWHAPRLSHEPRQASPAARYAAPVPPETTSHREYPPDPPPRPWPEGRPPRPSVVSRSCLRAHRTARCDGWHWRGSWFRPAPLYPSL